MSIVQDSRIKLTYEDYVRIPEDGRRHEIIDGVHYVTPSPVFNHQSVSGRLFVQLFHQIDESGLGRVVNASMDVLLSEVDIVQPDIVVILERNSSIITEKNVQGAPDLLIEILSPSTSGRDRNLKKTRYQRFGVSEYWIVDPEAKQVEQFALDADGVYESLGKHDSLGKEDAEITSAVATDVKIDLTKVW